VGKPNSGRAPREFAVFYDISSGYLRAAGTRLLTGRNIDGHDNAHSPPVALVNETFVHKLLKNQNPIGQHFRLGPDDSNTAIEIVGVVEDGKYQSLGEDPGAAIFRPVLQDYSPSTTVVARSFLPSNEVAGYIRRLIQNTDPDLPLFNVGSLKDQLALPLFPARVAAVVLGGFGLVALLLAATGVFALVSFSVSRRRREIGIRMALGARVDQILRFVLTRTLALCCIGIVFGTAFTLVAGRALSAVLYGVSPRDPAAFASALIVLSAVALLACWHPARRAIQIDPARTLREE
ncbi:MAG: ABC transporter permease, partial [Acidobacteriota bacterium]|nr:ABC transporter permease [Acidobacteriota bacterium]